MEKKEKSFSDFCRDWLCEKTVPMLTLFSGFDICILMVSFFRSVGKTRVYWNQVCPASIFLFTIFLRIYTLDFRTPAFRRKRSYEIVSVSRSVCQWVNYRSFESSKILYKMLLVKQLLLWSADIFINIR